MSASNHQISNGLFETEEELVPENMKCILHVLTLAGICDFYVSLPNDRGISEVQIQELDRAFSTVDRDIKISPDDLNVLSKRICPKSILRSDDLEIIQGLSAKVLLRIDHWKAEKHQQSSESTAQNDSSDAPIGPRRYPKRDAATNSAVLLGHIRDKIIFSVNIIAMSLGVGFFIWAKKNLTFLRESLMAIVDMDGKIQNHRSGHLWPREDFKKTIKTHLQPLLDMHEKFGLLNYLKFNDDRLQGQHLLFHEWQNTFIHFSWLEMVFAKAIDVGLLEIMEAQKLAGVLLEYGFDPKTYAGNSQKLPILTKEEFRQYIDQYSLSCPLPTELINMTVADELTKFRQSVRAKWNSR